MKTRKRAAKKSATDPFIPASPWAFYANEQPGPVHGEEPARAERPPRQRWWQRLRWWQRH